MVGSACLSGTLSLTGHPPLLCIEPYAVDTMDLTLALGGNGDFGA